MVIFVDAEREFDKTHSPRLIKIVFKRNLKSYFINIVRHIYLNSDFSKKVRTKTSKPVITTVT